MTARPVLLVHGFATSCARTWGETGVLALLEDAGRQIIGVDLLGHGDAPKPHEPEAYEDMERLVWQVLPDEPVDAIGYSMGGRMVLTLAAEDPSRFGRIVVAGIGANLFRTEASGFSIADAIEGRADPSNVVALHFKQLAEEPGNDPVALAACMRRKPRRLTPEALANVENEVLVVLGDEDFAGPAEPLVEALPNARLVTLRGVDHFATPKDFKFIDSALEFLDALPV